MNVQPSKTLERLNSVIEQTNNKPNALSFSVIGEDCERELWHMFRWSYVAPKQNQQRSRAMRLGKLIEKTVKQDLRQAGFRLHELDPHTGQPYTYSYLGGHFIGVIEGVIEGATELEDQPAALEISAVKATEFNAIVKKGLKVQNKRLHSKLMCAVSATETEKGIFILECKNTSNRFLYVVEASKMHFAALQAKAKRVIENNRVVPPAFYEAEDFRIKAFKSEADRRIYLGEQLPAPHCRNCRYSVPVVDDNSSSADWICKKHKTQIRKYDQEKGCVDHQFLPCLMPVPVKVESDDHVDYANTDGFRFRNVGIKDSKLDGKIPNISSQDLHLITHMHPLNKAILVDFDKKLNECRALMGYAGKSVPCSDCTHFIKSERSDSGVGTCKKNAPQTSSLYPNALRDCDFFWPINISNTNI